MNQQNSIHKKPRITSKIIVSATALLLAACQDQAPKSMNLAGEEQRDLTLTEMIKAEHKTPEDKEIAKGMQAIVDGDLQLASRTFRSLLIDDPLNANVHSLNALTYQLMSKGGDVAKLTLAKAGFEQTLKIDPDNLLASLQLGRIAAEQKDYPKAQEFFSNVLLLDSRNMEAQFELAAASYQLGDLKTAGMSISRVMKAHPNEPRNIRAAALIYAALGNNDKAQIYLSKYNALPLILKRHKKYLDQRVEDWRDLHKAGRVVAQAAATPDAAAPAAAAPADTAAPADAAAPAEAAPAEAAPAEAVVADAGPEQEIFKQDEKEDMVVIDAIIMRVSEEGTTSKGNNIMETLTLSLSPLNYFKARNTTGPIADGSIILKDASATSGAGNFTGSATSGTSTLITQGLSLGTINYSLNIANSGQQYAEIMGRPTLTTTMGKPAQFFSGKNRHISVGGQFGGNITTTPIGTTLNVTPISYKDGYITLDVTLKGSSLILTLPGGLTGAGAGQVFDINNDDITTTVRVKPGESVILAGITQRELVTGKSGFPILQDIPGIQYFFSRETTQSIRKSVMYILTPRNYESTVTEAGRYFTRGEEFGNRPSLTELEKRHKDWYDPSQNSIAVLTHLGPVYKEFRTGDLNVIKWGHDERVQTQVASIARFLWY